MGTLVIAEAAGGGVHLLGTLHNGDNYRIDLRETDLGVSMQWAEWGVIIDEKEVPRLTGKAIDSTVSLLGVAEGGSLFECLRQAFEYQPGLFERIVGYAPRDPTPEFGYPCAIAVYQQRVPA